MKGIGKPLLRFAAALLAACAFTACGGAPRVADSPIPTDGSGALAGGDSARQNNAGVVVRLGDQTITPYESFLWSEKGGVVGCAISFFYQLPDAAQELPHLKWGAAYEFEIELPEHAELLRFDLYDAAFERIHHQIPKTNLPAALAEAQGDVCYVVFQVLYQGEYIPSSEEYENSGYEYAFALELDAETPALEAWALEPEDVAYVERFDGSTEPGTPSRVWASDDEVAWVLEWLRGIKLLDFAGTRDPAEDTPGGSFFLVLHCFDGSAVNARFALDTVLTESGYYTYETEPDGLAAPPLALRVPLPRYPADSSHIPITLVNESGKQGSVSLAPVLERMTDQGWIPLSVSGGFCGTPDPFPVGVTEGWTVPLSLYEGVIPGVYRITLGARDAEGTELKISAVFTLTD